MQKTELAGEEKIEYKIIYNKTCTLQQWATKTPENIILYTYCLNLQLYIV